MLGGQGCLKLIPLKRGVRRVICTARVPNEGISLRLKVALPALLKGREVGRRRPIPEVLCKAVCLVLRVWVEGRAK